MITKEQAKDIYNIYSQIDTCEKLIEDLKNFIDQNGKHVPDIIDDNYTTYGSIQIQVPYFESGKFSSSGARIFNINYSMAIKVLKSHVRTLRNRLKKIDTEIIVENY